jgi:hypothetical protein
MPTRRLGVAAAGVNGLLYVVGGSSESRTDLATYFATVEAFDPTTNTWAAKAPMPTAREHLAVAVVNGVLYAMGGMPAYSQTTNAVEAYDPVTNRWTTKAPMPTACYGLGAGVVNGLIVAWGGLATVSSDSAPCGVNVYDPVANTWSSSSAGPADGLLWGVGVINRVLYGVGGVASQPPANQPRDTLEAYDAATKAWTIERSMPTARYGLGIGVVNGILYAVGGLTGLTFPGSSTGTNEAYQP